MDVRLLEEISTCHILDTNVISVTEYGVSLCSAPRKHFKTQDEDPPGITPKTTTNSYCLIWVKEGDRGKAPGEKEWREPEFIVAIGGGVIGSGQSPWRSLRVGGYRQNEGRFGPKDQIQEIYY